MGVGLMKNSDRLGVLCLRQVPLKSYSDNYLTIHDYLRLFFLFGYRLSLPKNLYDSIKFWLMEDNSYVN